MIFRIICLILIIFNYANCQTYVWQTIRSYDLTSMNSIQNDWNIINWPPGYVNNEMEQYLSDGRTIQANSNGLTINAYNAGNGDYRSGRLESKQTFSPLNVNGGRLRVEFTAKIPTAMGAWPALWMLGVSGVYGGWPQEGEIDNCEWVYQISHSMQSSLHWASGNDWGTQFWLGQQNMTDYWYSYGVEYSTGNPSDGSQYINFYVTGADGITTWGPRLYPSSWQGNWYPSPACGSPGCGPCTGLAPFDNQMVLIMNVAIGGDWGGCCGVTNYDAFNGAGQFMYVKAVTVQGLVQQ